MRQLLLAARASANLGVKADPTFSGALAWHLFYPWPQRPAGLVHEAFVELARRWRPILDAFDSAGVDLCFEIHPGEDLHDGVTFERFLDGVGGHVRANILYVQAILFYSTWTIWHSSMRTMIESKRFM